MLSRGQCDQLNNSTMAEGIRFKLSEGKWELNIILAWLPWNARKQIFCVSLQNLRSVLQCLLRNWVAMSQRSEPPRTSYPAHPVSCWLRQHFLRWLRYLNSQQMGISSFSQQAPERTVWVVQNWASKINFYGIFSTLSYLLRPWLNYL